MLVVKLMIVKFIQFVLKKMGRGTSLPGDIALRLDKDILKMLKKYNVKTIELGVQSTNNYILERCKRGHNFEDVKKASKLIKWYGAPNDGGAS